MNFNKFVISSLLLLPVIFVKAQTKFPGGVPGYATPNASLYVDVPTPGTASLGKYGDVGVSYFTGNPNISIPLYNLTVRNVTMPITLDYDATGVMVNSLPTWAGQNWTLNVGGVITRTVKGVYDEWIYPGHLSSRLIFNNYFQCHNELKELLGKSSNNYSALKDVVNHNSYDLSPDEYTFHFMGKSGKFYMDETGSWKVQSDDNLEVIFDCNKSSNFTTPLFSRFPDSFATYGAQPKTIAGFIIRDDKGNEYQFGYNKNAIEYTTNFWNMSNNESDESWHAMSWYLSKVTDKYGNVLFKLNYERGAYVIQAFNSYYSDFVKEKATGFLGAGMQYSTSNSFFPYTFSISSPVYLNKIIAMNGISVEVGSDNVPEAMATDSLYKSLYGNYDGVHGLYNMLSSMVCNWGPNQNTGYDVGAFYYLQQKGDSLDAFRYNPTNDNEFDVLNYARIRRISYVTIQCNKIPDNYIGYRFCTSIVNNRLKLDSLMIQDNVVHYSTSMGVKGVYRFKYNQFEKLPGDYLTSKVDHWGYYNGNPYNNTFWQIKPDLESVRNPNFAYTQIGILDEMEYPTSGSCVFEYEPNDYSCKLTSNRQSIEQVSGTGGGLRIKSIKLYESLAHDKLLRERDFSYNIPNSYESSGELFATPIYYWPDWPIKCEQSNATYHLSTDHSASIVPLANSFGPSLGYTYVTEIIKDLTKADGNLEKHVYKYSNLSDPSVRDQKFDLTFGYPNSVTPYDEYSEMGFKRGKLLNETTYDEDGNKVHATGCKYRSDDYLNNNYVLTSNLLYECTGNSSQYDHYLGGVYRLYYPKFDIVEKQDTIFSKDEAKPQVTITSYNKKDVEFTSWLPYRHNVDTRIVNSETISRGIFNKQNIYNFGDFTASGGNDSILYKGMSCIKPISISYVRNGQNVSTTKIEYNSMILNGKTRLVPGKVIYTNHTGNTQVLTSFSSYTNTGVPQIIKELGKPTIYLRWACNDNFLMMEGNSYIPFQFTDADFYNIENCRTKISNFIRGLSSVQMKGYVYDPLFGPVTIILPNGNITTYKYDRFGRLQDVYDFNNKLMTEYKYNYRR